MQQPFCMFGKTSAVQSANLDAVVGIWLSSFWLEVLEEVPDVLDIWPAFSLAISTKEMVLCSSLQYSASAQQQRENWLARAGWRHLVADDNRSMPADGEAIGAKAAACIGVTRQRKCIHRPQPPVAGACWLAHAGWRHLVDAAWHAAGRSIAFASFSISGRARIAQSPQADRALQPSPCSGGGLHASCAEKMRAIILSYPILSYPIL